MPAVPARCHHRDITDSTIDLMEAYLEITCRSAGPTTVPPAVTIPPGLFIGRLPITVTLEYLPPTVPFTCHSAWVQDHYRFCSVHCHHHHFIEPRAGLIPGPTWAVAWAISGPFLPTTVLFILGCTVLRWKMRWATVTTDSAICLLFDSFLGYHHCSYHSRCHHSTTSAGDYRASTTCHLGVTILPFLPFYMAS